ncbi:HAMP domain-containing protein [Desertivirga brevis]|uniref:HAMP domain-containing protein n=1 Tax=Desertivirga brevis TaxID=2810310 RepID=UPI001A95A433|nr:HAMP domain-containing protein [Pedobacter sp. SYSU D00873]
MNLKKRFSIYFSLLFSVVLATVLIAVYLLFSEYRQDDFNTRLFQRGETSIKFLVRVGKMNPELLDMFDKNRANKLMDEKTTIYNENYKRIYTSNDNDYFPWTLNDFENLKSKNTLTLRREGHYIAAKKYFFNKNHYYVVVSALDDFETSKVPYLRYLLFLGFVFGTASILVISFYVSKAGLKPLDSLREQMLEISEKNLQSRIELHPRNDEIVQLSKAFNQMMDRIDSAYQRQKEFTANASHELRTPLARITSLIQNSIYPGKPSEEDNQKKILHDIHQLSEIVTSLLLLSEIEEVSERKAFKVIRLDEVIFAVVQDFSMIHPELKFSFDIVNRSESISVEVKGDEILLKVAFSNLIKNAYFYSDDKSVRSLITVFDQTITVSFINNGPIPEIENPNSLFNTFARGSNSSGKSGSGVGLSLTKRILKSHDAALSYQTRGERINELVATFNRALPA